MSDLTIGLGLDANGFLSGMRSVEEQAAKGMAALQKSYTSAARSEKGLTDSRIASISQTLRNMAVQEQEIQKFAETAKAVTAYKAKRAELRAQYGSDTAAVNTAVAAWGKENNVLSLATIRTRELSVASEAAAAKARLQEANTNGLSGALGRLKGQAGGAVAAMKSMALAGLGIAGIAGIKTMTDDWTTLNNRLKLVTRSERELIDVRTKLINIAAASGQSLNSTVEIYQRLAQSQAETGLSGEQMVTVTKAINQAMVLGGGAAASQEAALVQLGQALASGTLRGQELNSVLEQAPGLAQAIAKGMGIPVGQLRTIAAEGNITSKALGDSLLKVAPEIEKEFAKTSRTIDQALTNIRTRMTEFVGGAGEASGAAQMLTSILQAVANNIDVIALAVTGFIGLQLAKYLIVTTVEVVALAASMVTQAGAANAAAVANTRFAASLAAIRSGKLTADISTLGGAIKKLGQVGAGGVNLAMIGGATAQVALFTFAAKAATDAFISMLAVMEGQDAGNDISNFFDKVLLKVGALKDETETLGTRLYDILHKDNGEVHTKKVVDLVVNTALLGPVFGLIKTLRGKTDAESKEEAKKAADPAYAASVKPLSAESKKAAEEISKLRAGLETTQQNLGKTNEQIQLARAESALEMLQKKETNEEALKAAKEDVKRAREAYKAIEDSKAKQKAQQEKEANAKWVDDYLSQLQTQSSEIGKSSLEIIAMRLAAKGATEAQIRQAQSTSALVEQQKKQAENQQWLGDYFKDLEKQTAALGKTKEQLIAMELAAKGASDADIRKAQAANGLIDAYQRQQQAMQTIESLRDQAATLGMTDSQKQLYQLQKNGASGEQLAEARSLLGQIDGFAKAQEQTKGAASTLQSAADKFNTGVNGFITISKDMSLRERMAARTQNDKLEAEQRKAREAAAFGTITSASGSGLSVGSFGSSIKAANDSSKFSANTANIQAQTLNVESAAMKALSPAAAAGISAGNGEAAKKYELVLSTPDGKSVTGTYVTKDNFDAFLDNSLQRRAKQYKQ